MELRWAGPQDTELLQEALLGAVNWDPGRRPMTREQMLRDEQLVRYLVDFADGRSFGVVAELHGRPIGIAWAVRMNAEAPGHGFVSADAPEIGLWVREQHRRQGHGRTLLGALVAEARRRQLPGLSLSVESFNPAVGLYQTYGFRTIGINGEAETMLLTLR